MNFINLTPHQIVIRIEGKPDRIIQPTGTVARLETETETASQYDGIPINRSVFKEVIGLPPMGQLQGCRYITSSLVAQAAERPDVLSPDTGQTAIRNAEGQIEAVTALQCFCGIRPTF